MFETQVVFIDNMLFALFVKLTAVFEQFQYNNLIVYTIVITCILFIFKIDIPHWKPCWNVTSYGVCSLYLSVVLKRLTTSKPHVYLRYGFRIFYFANIFSLTNCCVKQISFPGVIMVSVWIHIPICLNSICVRLPSNWTIRVAIANVLLPIIIFSNK